jgi:type IV secretion system protein VirB10
MAEPIINSQSSAPIEPELRQNPHEPMGVLRKNLKPLLYLGVAGLVIAAAVFSSTGKKTPAQQAAAQHEPPQPMVQDNTDNNVQDLKNQLATEKQQSTQAGLTPAQAAAMSSYSPTGQQTPCVPGQTCPQQQNGYGQATGEPQLSPAQQATQQLAIKERQLAYDSRFASNLVYALGTIGGACSPR